MDGLVVYSDNKVNPVNTSGNPKWAFAFKSNEIYTAIEVKIKDITWQESKGNRYTPVVWFNPIHLDGSQVQKATGHNYDFMKKKGIGIGAVVTIVKSGGIIPKVMEVKKKSKKMNLPKKFKDKGDKHIYTKKKTDASRAQALLFALNMIGIKTIGIKFCEQLVEHSIYNIYDILKADEEVLLAVLKQARSKVIKDQIWDKLDKMPLENIISALQIIPNISIKKFGLILEYYPKFVFDKSFKSLPEPKGIGSKTWKDISKKQKKFKKQLEKLGLKKRFKKKKKAPKDLKYQNRVFVFSGFRNQELEIAIKELGGKVVSAISNNVTDLIVEDPNSTSSKAKKAMDLGINIITLANFEI